MSIKAYEVGDHIFECKPFVHSLCSYLKSLVCDYCLLTIDGHQQDNSHHCQHCIQMFYCSHQCLRLDSEAHRLECSIYGQYYWKYLTTSFWRLILRSYLMVIKDKDFFIQTKNYRLYDGNERCFNDLETHSQHITGHKSRQMIFDDIYKCFDTFAKEFGFVLSRDLLFTLYGRLLINRFTIIDFRADKQEMMASALYMKASILNHSCSPNSATTYYGSTLVLKAIRQIAVGEEITINYCDIELRRDQRYHRLKEFFYFECKCRKCLNNDFGINYQLFEDCKQSLRTESLKASPDWEAISHLSETYVGLCFQIYGHFHPQLIAILIVVLSHKLRNNRENSERLQRFIREVRQKVELIFGINHVIYDEFTQCLQNQQLFHF